MTQSYTRPPIGASSLPMVKYSLPDLMAEILLEKRAGAVVAEKLAQGDIGKLFKSQPKRRRGKPGQ